MADESYITLGGLKIYTGKVKLKLADKANATDLTTEITRATAKENELQSKKLDKLPKPDDALAYHIPYHIIATPDATQINVTLKTITLDGNLDKIDFPFVIPAMTDTTAGLYNKDLADKKINVSDIVDNVTTDVATKPLSAKQGKELNDRIDSLSLWGRQLSGWDCTTGLPLTNPPGALPYTYKNGDFYIVSAVKSTLDNLIPSGTSYNGSASTTTTTAKIFVNDVFRFDGTTWILFHTEIPTTTFASLVGGPYDNTNLKNALDVKADISYVDNSVAKRVLGKISSGVGDALVFNEADGGGIKYEFADGHKSFVGVNNDTSDIMAQIYALDATNKGTRINVKQSAIYYTKGKDNPTVDALDEIATKRDVSSAEPAEYLKKAEVVTSGKDIYLKITDKDGTDIEFGKDKLNKLGKHHDPVSGIDYDYRFPFQMFVNPEAEQIDATYYALVVNTGVEETYHLYIPKANVADDKAGLYTKSIDDTLVKHSEMVQMTTADIDALIGVW